ncbi:hypothetical protein [Flavobacterium sp.]|uniref:hypothetical protein n=1 Tax=Flavobacterium sp. TaxID=239 RepID=UPI002C85870F|nr:hypothetical protein [Flavobacterium sp.]HQA73822.1 hypothetical protein [Flavobacterium sp.]
MVQSLKLIFSNKSEHLDVAFFEKKLLIPLQNQKVSECNTFDIEITFKDEINFFRNHNYQWIKCDRELVASLFTPKIIKLNNGFFVQPNIQSGIWEFNPKFKNKIRWRFNPEHAASITKYTGKKNEKIVQPVTANFDFSVELALLFSDKNAVEFSRSPIPFSAIACFTDHCDFDTQENLELQRVFFEQNNIKITKGFFLNHFSKRNENASFENNSTELLKWQKAGHELCYHSLSQSLKHNKESFEDFESFQPPIEVVPTWIDHGYQPYNFSFFENLGFEQEKFAAILNKNKITTLWNYIDSGTATLGVLNQLNSNDFTLKSYFAGIQDLKFKDKMALKIKIILFHFYGDRETIYNFNRVKRIIKLKQYSKICLFTINLTIVFFKIIKVFLFWNSTKSKPFKLAKYLPLVFKHRFQNSTFNIFQTVKIIDFRKALNKRNIDKLVNEKGIFIAHTYFSDSMKHHNGKLFKTPTTIDESVAQNFSYLSKKINEKTIWNPTLNELVLFLNKFEAIKLDVDKSGNIINLLHSDLPFRELY